MALLSLLRSLVGVVHSGHRYKEHKPVEGGDATPPRFACQARNCRCNDFFFIVAEVRMHCRMRRRCWCMTDDLVVWLACAFQGAWILRCRCKHKHTDHDPAAKPHGCTRPRCACGGFDRWAVAEQGVFVCLIACFLLLIVDATPFLSLGSPWVCNCGHPWAMHQQHTSYVNTPNSALLAATMAAAGVDVTPEMMAAMMEGMRDIAPIDQCRPDGLP